MPVLARRKSQPIYKANPNSQPGPWRQRQNIGHGHSHRRVQNRLEASKSAAGKPQDARSGSTSRLGLAL
eukprot:6185519-Pleurochrysis_carterae.AAC.4